MRTSACVCHAFGLVLLQILPIGFLGRQQLPELPTFPWHPNVSLTTTRRARDSCRPQCAGRLRMTSRAPLARPPLLCS